MRVTPLRFALFRLYNVTIGRFDWGDRALRKVLIHFLIRESTGHNTYCQSATFFSYDQLKERS